MSIFYSHSKKDQQGKRYGSKRLRVHVHGVKDKALAAFHPWLSFSLHGSQLLQVLEDVCLLHDLGKYTSYFQHYLLQSGPYTVDQKNHAGIGAYTILSKYSQSEQKLLQILGYFLVKNHHNSLPAIRNQEFHRESSIYSRQKVFEDQKSSLLENMATIEQELSVIGLGQWLIFPENAHYRRLCKKLGGKEASIENYFIINYLFSLLIEADKLDASDTPVYARIHIPVSSVDDYIAQKQAQDTPQNRLRASVRETVFAQLENKQILEQKIFSLTAPTGIGKTLTALDFALKLRRKIFEKENRLPQLIYALPFINIIEQALEEYRKVLPTGTKLLAHYQFADALAQMNDDEETSYDQKAMSLDTWQGDVVITTFVQFLQTLISNKNRLLKKFHHYAGAIIILDEVQTIKLQQLPLIGAAFHYLAKFLDCRLLVMTATRPKIFELAFTEILKQEGEPPVPVMELLPDHASVFARFQRTAIAPLIDEQIPDELTFVQSIFTVKWSPERSCLLVCNKVQRSIDVFKEIQGYLKQEALPNPVFYLSTNILPVHRLAIVEKVKKSIEEGECPVLVSTQSIEAGVDLDFDMAFRDMAPIDSIVQVAGRVNRNDNPAKKHSLVYIVDFGDCRDIYGTMTEAQARKALREASDNFKRVIPEEEYLQMVDSYFSNIADRSSFDDMEKIFQSMKTLNYDSDDTSVSSFRVIEEKGYAISVFIEIDEAGEKVRKAWQQLLNKEINMEEFSKKGGKKALHQRIVNVPAYLDKAIELKGRATRLLSEGIYWVPREETSLFYDVITGFKRDTGSTPTAGFF